MCETSNTPQRSRTAMCSARMPRIAVGDGHLPAGELDELGPGGEMALEQGRSVE